MSARTVIGRSREPEAHVYRSRLPFGSDDLKLAETVLCTCGACASGAGAHLEECLALQASVVRDVSKAIADARADEAARWRNGLDLVAQMLERTAPDVARPLAALVRDLTMFLRAAGGWLKADQARGPEVLAATCDGKPGPDGLCSTCGAAVLDAAAQAAPGLEDRLRSARDAFDRGWRRMRGAAEGALASLRQATDADSRWSPTVDLLEEAIAQDRADGFLWPARCSWACPHGDQCTLLAGHDGGHNHRGCGCNEPDRDGAEPLPTAMEYAADLGMCPTCGWRPVEGMAEYLRIHGDEARCLEPGCGADLALPVPVGFSCPHGQADRPGERCWECP